MKLGLPVHHVSSLAGSTLSGLKWGQFFFSMWISTVPGPCWRQSVNTC